MAGGDANALRRKVFDHACVFILFCCQCHDPRHASRGVEQLLHGIYVCGPHG